MKQSPALALGVTLFLSLASAPARSAVPQAVLPIVRGGKAVATLVLPAQPDADEEAAASELARVVEKMSGARPAVVREGKQPAGPKLWLGQTRFAKGLKLPLGTLSWDGFMMKTSGENLVLCGRMPLGTRFAVYRFLFKYGGVRWYLPTDLGEYIPQRKDWSVAALDAREEPDFASRQWSGASSFDGGRWEEHNLIRSHFAFHHNLAKVFPPELFEQHPDWFPLRDGKRYQPKDEKDHDWQPCLSNPEVAEYAAGVAARALDEDASLVSFSLGINDSNRFCECPGCEALIKRQKQFRGRPDASDLVFTFLNRAAAALVKTHPDGYLGCLAYLGCENVPSFKVHPHVIPYLTNDRAQWLDARFKAEDQALIRRWSRESPNLGIYDYYYGSGYVVPRLFTRLSKESLTFARDQHVKGFYGELYSNWSLDGPKAWVASQLLWDTDQDVSALLADFYTHFFQEASVPMRRYFELCERQWMGQKGPARWFRYFFDVDQLELFPPAVCREARGYLDQAARLARQDIVRRRVRLFSEGFHLTELYSKVYHLEAGLGRTHLHSEADGERALTSLDGLLDANAELERYSREVIATNDLHRPVIGFEQRARFARGRHLSVAIASLEGWATGETRWGRVKSAFDRVARQYPNTELPLAVEAHVRAHDHRGALIEAVNNAGFEEASPAGGRAPSVAREPATIPRPWTTWVRSGTSAELTWTREDAHHGSSSVRAAGATAAMILQIVPVQAGDTYLASVYAKGRVSPSNQTQLLVKWQDKEGRWVAANPAVDSLPEGETAEWTLLTTAFRVPSGVARAVVCLAVGEQAPEDYALFDDVSLKRVPPREAKAAVPGEGKATESGAR